MNIRKPLAGVATLWLALAPAAADQSNHWSPTTGTVSGLNLTNNYNGAFASVDSCNSGNSAPTNTLSGAPVEGMCWVDTSTNKLKFYDGASWLVAASFDPTAHIWKPAIGGVDRFGSDNRHRRAARDLSQRIRREDDQFIRDFSADRRGQVPGIRGIADPDQFRLADPADRREYRHAGGRHGDRRQSFAWRVPAGLFSGERPAADRRDAAVGRLSAEFSVRPDARQ
jgi:hypothetical protein